mmetsp:Transcript_12850/g.43812  ORF Transcript_12850/g.43812 Transcript_12850/m.43812 type:complete len:200 (+) Transcript_12850:1109-1708(+)
MNGPTRISQSLSSSSIPTVLFWKYSRAASSRSAHLGTGRAQAATAPPAATTPVQLRRSNRPSVKVRQFLTNSSRDAMDEPPGSTPARRRRHARRPPPRTMGAGGARPLSSTKVFADASACASMTSPLASRAAMASVAWPGSRTTSARSRSSSCFTDPPAAAHARSSTLPTRIMQRQSTWKKGGCRNEECFMSMTYIWAP